MVSVLTLVVTFKTADALAYAFGMAVTGTITITTLLFFYIARQHWRKPLWMVVPAATALLTVDLLFFAANLTKLVHGAWLPLLIAVAVFTVLTTWQKGRALVTRQRQLDEGPLGAFIDQIHASKPRLPRVPCTAVFLNRGNATAPLALRANVEHNKIDRITHLTARFGYADQPDVPGLLPLIRKAGIECPLDSNKLSYFLSTIELCRGTTPGMNQWRKRLFITTSRITADAAEYFQLPRDRTVIMGSRIEL